MTLSQPWDEFEIPVDSGTGDVVNTYSVEVVVAAGSREASGAVDLRIVPVGVE
jgi:hypothetical protein